MRNKAAMEVKKIEYHLLGQHLIHLLPQEIDQRRCRVDALLQS
jgi:hypothetical protein